MSNRQERRRRKAENRFRRIEADLEACKRVFLAECTGTLTPAAAKAAAAPYCRRVWHMRRPWMWGLDVQAYYQALKATALVLYPNPDHALAACAFHARRWVS